MESIGTPRFFTAHAATVRAVAFSPKDRFLFASGGNDGNICLYHAGRAELLNMFPVISSGMSRHVYALRYTCDGRKILAVTTTRRLSVLDVERGHLVSSYENCAYNGRDRAALAVDPASPHMAVCAYVNGKGLTMFDLRMPLPLNFFFDFHCDTIRDIQYLDGSWPFAKSSSLSSNGASPSIGQSSAAASSIMTLSSAGVTKICAVDGTVLHAFDFGQCANSVVATPEPFGSAAAEGFTSAILAGGTLISSYAPTPNGVNGNGYGSVLSPGPTVMTTSAGQPIPFTVEDVGMVGPIGPLPVQLNGQGGAGEFYGAPLQMVAPSGSGGAGAGAGGLPRSASVAGGSGGGGGGLPPGNNLLMPHFVRRSSSGGGGPGPSLMEQDVNPNPLPPPPGPPGPEGEGAVVIPLVADPSLNDPRLPHPQQQQQQNPPPLPPPPIAAIRDHSRRHDLSGGAVIFAHENSIRVRSLGNGNASGSGASGPPGSNIIVAASRFYGQRASGSSGGSGSDNSVASVSAIRAQILNHLQNAVAAGVAGVPQPPNYQPQEAVHYQVPSASSSAVLSRAQHLHQFLALNLMPVRGGASAAGGAGAVGNSVVSQMLAAGNNGSNVIVNSPPQISPSSNASHSSSTATQTQSQIVFHDTWDDTHHRTVFPSESSSPQNSSCNGQQIQLQYPPHFSPPHLIYFADGVYTTKPPLTAGGTALPTFIWRLKYSRSGAFLYAAGDGGSVRRYRQLPGQELRNLGDLFKHRGDVLDMDISPYDEYLVTASKDKTVGLLCLGAPNHGWTEYYELS
ncbi:hypothetical protein TYRP_015011 [Tyrophagus putrescentiae]|nr:hypothetical protein TYRP_015011 [Tyrophagus putrescentiae]